MKLLKRAIAWYVALWRSLPEMAAIANEIVIGSGGKSQEKWYHYRCGSCNRAFSGGKNALKKRSCPVCLEGELFLYEFGVRFSDINSQPDP